MKYLWVLFGLMAGAAQAAEETFEADAPTQYESGATLPITDLESWAVYCDGNKVATALVTTSRLSLKATVANGNRTCYATATTVYGQESGPSNTITFVSSPGKPKPPRNFTKL